MISIPKALVHLSSDATIRSVIEQIDLSKTDPAGNVYDGLLSSICSQQLSVKAAASIYGRFLDLFDGDPSPDKLLAATVEQLRAVGLSYRKASYVHNVAAYFQQHQLIDYDWSTMDDTAIIDRLTQIKGVGVWTVQMILMFELERPDVMPVGDLGIQNAMKKLYDLNTEKRQLENEMLEIAASWSPYRSIACRYLWQYYD